jgi:hypothetical protein
MSKRYNNLGEQVIKKEKYNNLGQPMFKKKKLKKLEKKKKMDYPKGLGADNKASEEFFP